MSATATNILAMDPDREEEEEVFLDTEDPSPPRADEEEEEGEEQEEEDEEEEEEDARIFDAWMQRYRGGDLQERNEEEEDGDGASEGGWAGGRGLGVGPPVRMRGDRRASLPCPVREQKPAHFPPHLVSSLVPVTGMLTRMVIRKLLSWQYSVPPQVAVKKVQNSNFISFRPAGSTFTANLKLERSRTSMISSTQFI